MTINEFVLVDETEVAAVAERNGVEEIERRTDRC